MSKKIFSVVFALFLLVACFEFSSATQFRAGDNLIFTSDKKIDDDLMAAGGKVKFDGILSGDLLVAASSVAQNGTIEGSFMAAAQQIDISGPINKSSRTFSQYVNISSSVSQNVMAFCQRCDLKSSGYVGKDFHAFCSELNVDGKVKGNLKGYAETVTISGAIEGDVSLVAERIVLTPSAKINGNLNYKSPNEADIQKGATVLGKTQWKKTEPKKKGTAPGRFILNRFLSFLGVLIPGLILIPIFKEQTQRINTNLKNSPFKSLAIGFIFLICMLVIFIIFFMLSFVIIGIPLAVLSLMVILSMLFLCKIAVGVALGDWLLSFLSSNGNVNTILALLVGLIILTLLTSIPYFIGTLFYLIILFSGTGAIIYVKRKAS
ncbi:MAG: polymer-forming cytoskeletal protein [candidate division Zixibacteria bacterium]|nr:polymer-forming cytoskeletal protein [candidate division Zixibacteria bacterium]